MDVITPKRPKGIGMKPYILALTLSSISALSVAQSMLPDATKDGIHQVKHWAKQRVKQAEDTFQNTGEYREPSPSFWGNQIIYQIQVDRFNNGDSSNDNLNIEPFQRQHQNTNDLYGLLDYKHGGDIKGITQRLDYIKDLGATTLWLTPILKHNGSYHGYCTADFSEIDPGFGTKDELRTLVKKAHQKGIKVILDVVINHMCDRNTLYKKDPQHYSCANELNQKNWEGFPGGAQYSGELSFGKQFFPPLKSQHFFNRCGANSPEDMQGTEPVAIYGDFVAAMFDFDTRNHDFQKIFTDLHKYWIAYTDVDGFRLDAAKHVTEDFIAYFSTQIRNYAKSVGKDNFFLVGEVAGPSDWIGRRLGKMYSNPHNPYDRGVVPFSLTRRMVEIKDTYLSHSQAPYPGLNAVYDFAHGGTAVDVLLGKRSTKAIEAHFSSNYFMDLAHQNDYRLNWNLLEIHDWPRFVSHAPQSPEKSILGISYLATAEGSPVIYYGMEQGFNGDCHFDKIHAGAATEEIKTNCKSHSHSLYRQNMFMGGMFKLGSTVSDINKLAYIGKPQDRIPLNWRNDLYLNRNHDVYKTARRMLHIRKSCNALSYGSTQFRYNNGILAFSRIDKGNEALVIHNTGYQDSVIPEMKIANGNSGEKWVNLLNSHENAWATSNGSLSFHGLTIKGNSTMIFVHHSQVTPYNNYLEAHLCKDNT